MEYSEALDYIHGTLKFGSKLGLSNIANLLELMGNPHQKLKFVHVAGTNGKGSTVAFISSILIEAGYRVGIYTSPYIQRFTERIKVNNAEIHKADLARITGFVKEKVGIMVERGDNHPTEFEIVTALAFQYYFEKNCDVVVLEVGLGGRFDATNVITTPLASVITTISYDHMSILGDTLPKIAFEKAGIIKKRGDVVLYPSRDREVEEVFKKACLERDALLHKVDFGRLNITNYDIDGQRFDYKEYKNLKISLLGEHQTKNAAIAVETAEILIGKGYGIDEQAIRQGLLNARWPGRLEVLSRAPLLLIDGAHNEEGARVLADALDKYFPNRRKIFIFGVLKDKEYDRILEIVTKDASCFITVTPNSPRALPAPELSAVVKKYCENVVISDTIREGVQKSLSMASNDDIICAFGSLYYIGEVREMFI